jgi:mevalonate kinase
LGSSGTLVAAFYDRYALDKTEDLMQLKNRLAALENAFHGASSGIDPLVSYLNLPLKINENRVFVLPELAISNYGLCLIDTGKPRQTAHLMSTFNNKLNSIEFSQSLDKLCQYNTSAIQALENNQYTHLKNAFYNISKIQYNFFAEMIPDSIKSAWKSGLNSGKYFFKLCGAGGGGMLLCLTVDMDYADKKLNTYHKTFL